MWFSVAHMMPVPADGKKKKNSSSEDILDRFSPVRSPSVPLTPTTTTAKGAGRRL